MDDTAFSFPEIKVMRQAFDSLVEHGSTTRDELARMVFRAAREQGASNRDAVIERVRRMLPTPRKELA